VRVGDLGLSFGTAASVLPTEVGDPE